MKTLRGYFVVLMVAMLPFASHPAWAREAPQAVRIGLPDLSPGDKPVATGPLGDVQHHRLLEKAFAADGIEVEWHFFKGAGPAINEALANRQLDFALLGDLPAIIGRAQGLDTRLLLGQRGSNLFLAATPQAGIREVADLKGKRVAIYRGTADQLSFDRLLHGAGLSERDLKVVNLDWSAARAALAAGHIDATWSNLYLLRLREQGLDIPLSTLALGPQATTQGGLVADAAFIQRYPEVTQRLIDVLVAELAKVSQPEALPAYLAAQAQKSGMPLWLLTEEMGDSDPRFRFSPRLDRFLQDSFASSIEQAAQLRLIRKPFAVQAWFAPAFVESAIERQRLQGLWPDYDGSGAAR
ncbi:sulfonate transport system substrate-binding protein [Pseudomonas flavescens]|uniref:Sulfonate transport system substrate-binding protein n=1 Tax=Phytopseudomonas flavescens TaxID=29435 RepID=A0A1G8G0V9_9GAMM|nr:ABC transporter substrate-binding protein [Pseudomonas flavescens]SDH87988.1 sulfonate transport system substrate-binding protein [Pseudomonas flavescens]